MSWSFDAMSGLTVEGNWTSSSRNQRSLLDGKWNAFKNNKMSSCLLHRRQDWRDWMSRCMWKTGALALPPAVILVCKISLAVKINDESDWKLDVFCWAIYRRYWIQETEDYKDIVVTSWWTYHKQAMLSETTVLHYLGSVWLEVSHINGQLIINREEGHPARLPENRKTQDKQT